VLEIVDLYFSCSKEKARRRVFRGGALEIDQPNG
jgi:hypothetical protein